MTQDLGTRELVLMLQAGQLQALGELYDRHQNLVFRTALAITGDREAAADLRARVSGPARRLGDLEWEHGRMGLRGTQDAGSRKGHAGHGAGRNGRFGAPCHRMPAQVRLHAEARRRHSVESS